jgi:hypothetical protein
MCSMSSNGCEFEICKFSSQTVLTLYANILVHWHENSDKIRETAQRLRTAYYQCSCFASAFVFVAKQDC